MSKFGWMLVDPSSPLGYSCSRFGLLLMNLCAVAASVFMLVNGQDPTELVKGMAYADAGVYGANSLGRFLDKRGTARPNPNAA